MNTENQFTETTENLEKSDIEKDLNNKYLRLYADFENYKKRVQKEKEDIRNFTKLDTLTAVLDIDNDLSLALSKIEDKGGLNLIMSKLDRFLKSQGIETIQTDKYDSDLHEVTSVIESDISDGDAYKNYKTKTEIMMGHGFHGTLLSQEDFINKIKTDDEFAKTWGNNDNKIIEVVSKGYTLNGRIIRYPKVILSKSKD
jgi:molecular chaperone GrpE